VLASTGSAQHSIAALTHAETHTQHRNCIQYVYTVYCADSMNCTDAEEQGCNIRGPPLPSDIDPIRPLGENVPKRQ
jgi:hypothetical protein